MARATAHSHGPSSLSSCSRAFRPCTDSVTQRGNIPHKPRSVIFRGPRHTAFPVGNDLSRALGEKAFTSTRTPRVRVLPGADSCFSPNIDDVSLCQVRRSNYPYEIGLVIYLEFSGMQTSSVMMSPSRLGPLAFACRMDTGTDSGQVTASVDIRVAENHADLEKIYRFRYEIYVEEMGRVQKYADHARRRIEDPLDQIAVNLAAFRNGEVAGVVRINFPRESDVGDYERFYHLSSVGKDHPAHTSINTRLMIAPEYRKGRLAVRLAIACYEYVVVRGIRWNFIDCNAHLISFFRGFGYVEHIAPAHHPEYGTVTRMRLDALNMEHLQAERSPFARCLARFPDVVRSVNDANTIKRSAP